MNSLWSNWISQISFINEILLDYFIILTYFLVKKQGSIGLYSTEGKEAKNKERGSTKMVYSILMKNCHFLPKWVFFVHHLPQLAKFLADNASRRIDANTMMIDAFNREGFIKIKASLCQLTNHHLKIGQQYPKCWLKIHIYISTLHLMNPSPRDFLLCSPLVREKGEAKPLRKCRKCQKYQVHCICQKEEPRTQRPNYLIHTDYSGDHIYPDLTKFH